MDLLPAHPRRILQVLQLCLERGLIRIEQHCDQSEVGTRSRSKPSRFAPRRSIRTTMPVTLPPGLLKLATKPIFIGSSPLVKTIGIADVAAFTASAVGGPPAKITAA